jgi:hypothetical protein
MRVQLTACVAFLSLLAAASLSPNLANAKAAAPVADRDPPPVETASPEVRFHYELESTDSGVRHLVLRDNADLRLPLGDVQPYWACDATVDEDFNGMYGLRVECGGGAVGAQASYFGRDGTYWPEYDKLTVRSHGEHPVQYTVPVPRNTHVELRHELFDPQIDCDPSGPSDVDLSVERVALGPGKDDGAPIQRLVLRSRAYPIEAMVEGNAHQDCLIERETYFSDLEVHCPYRDAPADPIIGVIVRGGAIVWREGFAMPCAGGPKLHGGWRLGCGATIHWPPATVSVEEEPFVADNE